MQKILFIALTAICGLFGTAQVLQLLGLIGNKQFSIAGIVFAIIGFGFAVRCYDKVKSLQEEK